MILFKTLWYNIQRDTGVMMPRLHERHASDCAACSTQADHAMALQYDSVETQLRNHRVPRPEGFNWGKALNPDDPAGSDLLAVPLKDPVPFRKSKVWCSQSQSQSQKIDAWNLLWGKLMAATIEGV